METESGWEVPRAMGQWQWRGATVTMYEYEISCWNDKNVLE